jgi:hypothetical protein
MKGIIFNLIEEIVRAEYGEDTWDDLLEAADLEGAYSSLGSYADDDFAKLVCAASEELHLSPEDVVCWIGRKSIPHMAAAYPHFFTAHLNTRSFILALNDIIHPEVRKLYPGADVPVFDFDTTREEVLVVGYHSHRKMCAFAQGLVEGASAYYGEEVVFEQSLCMNRGDAQCLFHIRFRKSEV